MAKTEIIDHDGIVRETDEAKLFRLADGPMWIPKSQISDEDETWVELPTWLAADKGLV